MNIKRLHPSFPVVRHHTAVTGDCNLSLPSSNRVFTEGTCKLLKLVISDLVDEDFVVNRRQQAVSALLFGMVALLTKPGQTLAPLIGTWLLCVYTGTDRNVAPHNHIVSLFQILLHSCVLPTDKASSRSAGPVNSKNSRTVYDQRLWRWMNYLLKPLESGTVVNERLIQNATCTTSLTG